MKSKAEIRQMIAEKRKALNDDWVADASLHIREQLQQLDVFKTAQHIAFYKAIGGEVDLEALFRICWNQNKSTCIPVFNNEKRIYELTDINEETLFRIGNFGIQEPEPPALLSVVPIDLMIVPGVAFDQQGNRLGRGGGYYDRLLDGFSGISVAVAFDFQVLPSIPFDSHDIPVDYVVTETKSLNVQNEH